MNLGANLYSSNAAGMEQHNDKKISGIFSKWISVAERLLWRIVVTSQNNSPK